MTRADDIYRKHHVDKDDERLELFSGLAERYGVSAALYPGSFVHVTPSFVIPTVVYSDSDRSAARFFADPGMLDLVRRMKRYEQEPVVRFRAGNYERAIDEPDESFDLLISQYAGFISRACKRYLRVGGYLAVNNSHGDASMAALDPHYSLAAVYRRRSQRFTFSADDLHTYMVPKHGVVPSREELETTMRGSGLHPAGRGIRLRTGRMSWQPRAGRTSSRSSTRLTEVKDAAEAARYASLVVPCERGHGVERQVRRADERPAGRQGHPAAGRLQRHLLQGQPRRP